MKQPDFKNSLDNILVGRRKTNHNKFNTLLAQIHSVFGLQLMTYGWRSMEILDD